MPTAGPNEARYTDCTLVRLSVCFALTAAILITVPARAQQPTHRLNPTGKPISLSVPLKDDGRELGEIVVRIDHEDNLTIPKKALIAQLGTPLDDKARASLEALPDENGYVALAAVGRAGVALEFDRGRLELALRPTAEQRPEGEVSVGRRHSPVASSVAAKPAIFSSYLNALFGVDHRWGGDAAGSATGGRIELQSVFRLYNIVLENELVYDGAVDAGFCPIGAWCTYLHEEGWKLRRSRFVYDIPHWQVRVQAGDAELLATGPQRSPEVLGISIEKSPRKLEPGTSIRPVGRSSFRLERNADVEVIVNGVVVTRLRLRAGTHSLTDLPLGTGANEVRLRIIDETGAERTLDFTTFYDSALLGAGKSEWSVAAGVPSYFRDGERHYKDDDHLVTGFFRWGLSERLTSEVHAQADRDVVMGGLGIFAMTPWALVAMQGAVSESDVGAGFMVSGAVERSNAWGPFSYWTGLRESARIGAEYRSNAFRVPGEYVETASGILYPQHPYWLKLYGSYSVPLRWGASITISGRYQFSDPDAFAISPWTIRGDRYGADLTLSAPLNNWATGSLSVGYSNEYFRWLPTDVEDGADLRVMARLYLRPDHRSTVTASYDSLNQETQVSGRYEHGQGVGRWETSVDASRFGRQETGLVSAQAAYSGNRFETRVSNTSLFESDAWYSGRFDGGGNVTSVTLGTAVAFADGAFAIGPPIRGHGFAIVEPHESLAGRRVTVGAPDHVHAYADRLGPGLVTDVPAYASRSLPVDVDDLPLGYSLGQGGFETNAPYRGGYRIVVGSDYSVTAYGTLLDASGEPLNLLSGTAQQAEVPDKQVAVFTNAVGRFGIDGMAPGRWIIEMAADAGPVRYVIEVPKGTDGLFRAGTLTPEKAGSP